MIAAVALEFIRFCNDKCIFEHKDIKWRMTNFSIVLLSMKLQYKVVSPLSVDRFVHIKAGSAAGRCK